MSCCPRHLGNTSSARASATRGSDRGHFHRAQEPDEWQPCVDVVGEADWCSAAADAELDDCASGQDYAVQPEFGGQLHVDFECLLPPPYSMTSLGEPMSMGPCDGSFWGTVTMEPGELGCEEVYDGTWVAADPDCNAGPADVIVLAG